jgi:hypothetical protein
MRPSAKSELTDFECVLSSLHCDRKVIMFNPWQFGLDVQQVITTRVLSMMTGDLSPREAQRMITEKQTAFSNAQVAGACALWTEGPVAAGREMLEVYQRVVSANCDRLSSAWRPL